MQLVNMAKIFFLGFTISLKEFKETVESLWSVTRVWMDANKEMVVPSDHPGNLMKFITEDGGSTYNMCHFWSNFEVGKELISYNFHEREKLSGGVG